MATIRKASLDDLDQLILWGARFHAASNWVLVPFVESAFRQTLISIMDRQDAVLLMHDHGMVSAFLGPLWFSDRHIIAQEIFWYAEKDGGQLLNAVKEWARENGAIYFLTSGLKDDSGRIQRLYEKKGYELAEYHYRIRLSSWDLQRPSD